VSQRLDTHPAEGSLVYEPQLATPVGEGESDAQVRLVLAFGWLHKQLSTHTQVGHECEIGFVKSQPEELPSTLDSGDCSPDECGCEGLLRSTN